MGASKRIMELFLLRESIDIPISTARFANVAFSDGSLLYGFQQRIQKKQPLVAPNDIKRYFVTPQESGELCLMSSLLGQNKDIFFPKLTSEFMLTSFSEIAERFLIQYGYKPFLCKTEEEARGYMSELPSLGKWPCFFSESTTTGEKAYEEFYMEGEDIDMAKFKNIGIVKNTVSYDSVALDAFLYEIDNLVKIETWDKSILLGMFNKLIPEFNHNELGKDLDGKM
jgi:hypothetical protein